MKLEFCWHDMRGGHSSPVTIRTDIVDAETGKKVGFHVETKTPGSGYSRHVSLFDGTYQADFMRPEECFAFVKGVEQVLSRMLGSASETQVSEQAA